MSRTYEECFGPGTDVSALGSCGLEVRGLDLERFCSEDDDDSERLALLRDRIVAEGLVIFRGQRLAPTSQVALGRRFGLLESLVAEPDPKEGDGERNAGHGGAQRHEVAEEAALIVIGNVDERGETLADDEPRMKLMSINEASMRGIRA